MKKLKISLAMGGGVSLGTFSGAALTESLKLLLLYGQDDEGNPYSGIEVDSMSGASAGSIALAIMLRALLDYKSVLKKAGYNHKGDVQKELEKEFPELITNSVQRRKLEDLIALQVAQKLQEKIWVEELTIGNLIDGKIEGDYNVEDAFGLLDRGEIKRQVKKYIYSDIDKISKDTLKVVNDKRFLFACSLSNLTPIKSPGVMQRFDKTNEGSKYQLVKNLLTSVSSFEHAEVRVIDFIFDDKDGTIKSDEKWLTFGNDSILEKIKTPNKFDINESQSWKVLAASAIACGAFPVAFQPLLLKRYNEEFGDAWPIIFKTINKKISKDGIVNNSFIDKEKSLDYSSFNFAYVDGGTFNNEPIKEAFKLAYFQDFNDPKKDSNDYDRIVLFVDPIVRTSDPLFQQSTYFSVSSEQKKKKIKYSEKTEFSKMFGVVGSLVGMLTRQGSIKEEHKVDRYIENQLLNNYLQSYLANSGTVYSPKNNGLFKTTIDKVNYYLRGGLIPCGTRNIEVYLSRLTQKKYIDLQGNQKDVFDVIQNLSVAIIKQLLVALTENKYDLIIALNSIDEIKSGIANADQRILNEILQLFLLSLSEVGLKTLGKDVSAIRVGITPHNIKSQKVVKLPGTEFAAFGGFMDKKTRQYGFEYGKLCALNILEGNQFRQYHEDITKDLAISTAEKLPFIDPTNPEIIQAKDRIIKSLKGLDYYSNHIEEYSDSLFKIGFKKFSSRINKMFKIGFWTSFLGGIILTIGSIGNIFTDRLLKWFIKVGVRVGIGINNKKIEKTFQPIKIRIVIDDAYLVNLYYTTINNRDKKKKLNFIERKVDNKKKIELQLFLDTKDLGNEETKIRILPNSSLPLQKVDPNLEPVNSYGDPIRHLFIDSFYNFLKRGVKHDIDLESLINNKNESIYYSIRALDFHINPMIELTPNPDGSCDVLFKEGTTAFEFEMKD